MHSLELINGNLKADGLEILRDVNFRIRRGKISLLFGPNGSGKTTVFKALMGIIKAGRVILDGEEVSDLPSYKRFERGIILSPERMRVARNLTVEENLLIGGDVEFVYEKFPVLKKMRREKAKNLSGGERQLVVFGRAIASAVSKARSYLLFDEPFQGVHPSHSDTMIKVFEELKNERKGIAIISHERIEDLLKISDEMTIMLGGKIVHHSEIEDYTTAIRKLEDFMLI